MNKPHLKYIKNVLWDRFAVTTRKEFDSDGYVNSPEDNLLPGVTLADFADDFMQGSGKELDGKFRAIHSSSALAANTFGPFRQNPSSLQLIGEKNFNRVIFERQCPTGLGGTPPNLDVLVENSKSVIGIESKFLEYFTPKQPKFSQSYCKENLPQAETDWIYLLEELRQQGPQFLDSAQLVKHYLGLRNQPEFKNREITLLYLFWEPEDWRSLDACRYHRSQIEIFAEYVSDSEVSFYWQSYPELWREWKYHSDLAEHAHNLEQRYLVDIPYITGPSGFTYQLV